ncbi:putative UDP-glucose 4-epimerase [Bradyrhizobium sp. ORS 285]|uniref:NAD-dependent epimerase/dehydratase family protein n=1 Tax=Bradyrhizobium sp. ORS 285 TaxID=115808 RepID=UPI0002409A8F|nr:NAD(P)-dependent oxidoreductase [Bradyrhizobium sp. ORS 285]CCD87544.1 putative UDP-glucose 4-epimerase [Bradyrhizobium sp. ORS 285]SMX60302.1 putative UDP-glucose 4-epimerase [Bradyrhizobium sp. ORS 285]
MHVLIFGGAGFVGLNIAQGLLERGHAVTVFDAAPLPNAAQLAFAPYGERLQVITGDVTDAGAVAAAVGAGCDAVVMGAAITAGPERDASDPERILAVNLLAQVPILRAARSSDVRRVINLSSAASYGASGQRFAVLEETTPCEPVSLYAITKFTSERVAARLSDLWKTDVISVRLSAVFGPFERGGGVRDTPSPQALIAACCARNEPALLNELGDKDWVYAVDVADAVCLLLEAEKPQQTLYNISNEHTFSAEAWGRAFASGRAGFACRLAQQDETPTVPVFAPVRGRLSTTRLADEFGWRARFDCAASAEHFGRWFDQYGRE